MNGFDIVLLALACGLVVIGMVKGLVRILIGLAAIVFAFILAAYYHQPLAARLAESNVPGELLRLASYAAIFLGVMIVGSVIAFLTRKLLKVAMLGWADRLAGGLLGLAAAFICASLLIVPVVAYSPKGASMMRESTLAPYVTVVADLVRPLVPNGLSERYRERVEQLRELWRDVDTADMAMLEDDA